MPGGRKRTPDNLKVIKGTARKHRVNEAQPLAAEDLPRAPHWLTRGGCEYFGTLQARLNDYGLASSSYTEAIALAAMRLDEIDQLTKDIAERGMTYEAENREGVKMRKNNPAVAMRSEAMRHLQSLLAELGLTPAAISKVSAGKGKAPAAADPWAMFS